MRSNCRAFLSLFVVTTFLLLAHPSQAKKEYQWQMGKLLDSDTKTGSRLAGVNGVISEHRNDLTCYQIETPQFTYIVCRTLERRRDKPLNVTINAPVQFAIYGEDVFMKDDRGEIHKLTLEKKILIPAK